MYHFSELCVLCARHLFSDWDFLAPNSPSPLSSDLLSFRPKGEIYLRSLALARDDGPRPVTLVPLRLCERYSFPIRIFSRQARQVRKGLTAFPEYHCYLAYFATFARDNDFSGFPNPQSKIENPKLVDRQGKNKGAAFADFTLDPDSAAMQFDELLRQG